MTRRTVFAVTPALFASCCLATCPIARAQSTRPPSAAGAPRQQLPARQSAGGAPRGGATAAETAPARPRLSPEQQAQLSARLAWEQQQVDRVLEAWERESKKVKTLSATFHMWEYRSTFAPAVQPGQPPKAARECDGEIYFAAPDRGKYHEKMEGGAYWVCDGKSIYELRHKTREVVEHPLPEELRGKAIAQTPLPFVFGAEAAALKQRYTMRIVTPSEVQGQIWLEAYPRYQHDAANFRKVEVILDEQTMLPRGMQLWLPNDPSGRDRTAYSFDKPKVNDAWEKIKGFFDPPLLPRGWTRVVEQPPVPPQTEPPPRGGQAQRVPPPVRPR